MQKILYLLFIAVIAFHSGDGMVSKETIDGPGGYEALFTHGNLHEIEIIITKEEWNGLIQDMKDYAEDDWNGLMRTGNYRKADLIYKGPAGDTIIEDVGFRTKGNVSRVIPQDDNGNFHRSHFKVKFDKTFDIQKGTDEYEERKERRFCELKSLNLRWHMSGSPKMGMGIDEDTSQIRELYCYDLLNKAGIYTSKTGSARLAINIDGEKHYFGIYTIMEPVDKLFLTKRFGTKKNDGNLYKCLLGDSGPASLEPTGDHVNFFFREERIIGVEDWESHYRPTYDLKTNEDEADHTELLNFINNINTLSGDALKDYLDDKFEIDRFLRYQAMNVLLGKWDDYWAVGNNYYLYFSNDGKIEFLTFDYDMALGGGFALFDTASIGIYDWSNHVNELMAISSGFPLKFVDAVLNYNSPLVEKMFGIEEYRDKYEDYLKDFITPSNKLFIYSEYEKKYNFIHSLYSPYLANDTGEGEVMSNDESTREYFYKRTKSIIDELGLNEKEYETKPLSLDAPTGVSATDGTYPHMICVTWNTVPYSEYYRVYRSDFADGDYDQIGDNIRETGFDDESVTANSTYYYKVKAFIDEGVESEFSIHDVGSTNDGSITAPTWVTATDGFYSYMIAVSWDPVLNADYYKVYRSDSIDGTYGRISYNVEETSYNDRSIVANSIYYYRVKAFTNDGAETDFSIADKGSTSDTGLSTPEIIPGAPLISGFYSHSDDTGITTYTFEDDKTCTVSTPNPRDPKSGNLVTKGEWGYDDDDVLTIDTTGSIGGVITIDVTETWENAFTINNGYYLNFVNLKKKTGGQDCILGKYEGGGNVHVLVTAPSGSIITEEKISITAEVTINDDGTKETMYNISGDINTITETWSVEDNKLIEFDGYYYMPFSGENIIYTRQKAICPLSVALKSEEHINTLRNIRDFKPENRNWQNFVTMYYSNALEISTILLTNTVLKEKLKELVVKNIGIAEEYMESGSISLNENVIEDIITFLNKLKKAGSPKLKNDIEVVIEGINKNFLKGINVNVN